MNAAFVILASVLVANPPASSCNTCAAPVASCSTCDSHCGHSSGWKFRGTFSGLFSKHSCGSSCATPCATPCPAPCPAPAPVCATPCATPCNTCGHSHQSSWGNGQLLCKLRSRWHTSNSCNTCAPACDSCGAATVAPAAPMTPVAPGAGETIKDAPKKMPDAPKGDAPKADAPKGDKAVQFQETPEAPLAIPAVPVVNPVSNARPNVIVAPATLRNPF